MLDVADRTAFENYAQEVASHFGSVHLVINNAGVALNARIDEMTVEELEWQMSINFWGVAYGTLFFLPYLKQAEEAHIVNISSIFGIVGFPGVGAYNASKFAVKAINEGIALDLLGTRIRVTSIDPGLVETEFSEVRFHGDKARAETVYEGYDPLTGEDIADIVSYVVNTPDHVNILDLIVLPTAQRSAHMVHKEPAPK